MQSHLVVDHLESDHYFVEHLVVVDRVLVVDHLVVVPHLEVADRNVAGHLAMADRLVVVDLGAGRLVMVHCL